MKLFDPSDGFVACGIHVGSPISPKVEIIIEDSKLKALPREAVGSKPITYLIGENDL
jgi:hypothetical protein